MISYNKNIPLLCLVFVSLALQAQDSTPVLAFYNVENLFDTIDVAGKMDEEFTPESEKGWSSYRYWAKQKRMAKVIRSQGSWEAPVLVGLAEVENRKVCEDLISRDPLRKYPYKIVHFESDDPRGIDVALLYRADFFTTVYNHPIKVEGLNTRDILYSKGFTKDGDTLHLFVNHWPSRRGGRRKSEPKRLLTAERLKTFIDSLSKDRQVNVLVMGDFNDTPKDKSVNIICAQDEWHNHSASEGSESHYYKGEWSALDQIWSNCLSVELKTVVFRAEGVVKDGRPYNTWGGPYYKGGYSDHLAISIPLLWKKEE